MSGERLYYDNSLQLAFRARIMERLQVEGRPAVLLDRSAFYPTSGGQPHDLGTLEEVASEAARRVPVLDVLEKEGAVVHVLAAEIAGEMVRGQVDGERRFDHMQQHTGQHILSQAFIELLDAETISFHLGESYCSIDLNRAGLSPEDLVRVEERANAIVFEDRAVLARFVDAKELAAMPLRKPPVGHERVRVVEVQGFDWSPCGGTHCGSSGQVGAIHISQGERRGEETRVSFFCGWRALRDARRKRELLKALAVPFSVGLPELPATIARLVEAEEMARKELERARRQLLHHEAAERYREAELIGPARVVWALFEDRPLDQVRLLAREIAGLPGGVALLGLGGKTGRLCFARAEGLPWDMGALVRQAAAVLGGRGGGRPHEAQGGGPEAGQLEEALRQAMEQLRSK